MVIALAAVEVYDFYETGTVASFKITFDLAALLFLANTFWFRYKVTSSLGVVVFFGLSILISLSLSADLARSALKKAEKNPDVLSVVTTKSDTINGYLIMAGERGILLYKPDKNRISFQRSDEVQSIEWQR
jgi:hypothetical protein